MFSFSCDTGMSLKVVFFSECVATCTDAICTSLYYNM